MIHMVCAILNGLYHIIHNLYALTDCPLAFECDTPWKKFLTPRYKVTAFRFVISFFSFNWISIKYSVEIRVPIDKIKCALVVFANRHSLITHYEIADYPLNRFTKRWAWYGEAIIVVLNQLETVISHTTYVIRLCFKCLIWQDNVDLLK